MMSYISGFGGLRPLELRWLDLWSRLLSSPSVDSLFAELWSFGDFSQVTELNMLQASGAGGAVWVYSLVRVIAAVVVVAAAAALRLGGANSSSHARARRADLRLHGYARGLPLYARALKVLNVQSEYTRSTWALLLADTGSTNFRSQTRQLITVQRHRFLAYSQSHIHA